MSGNPNSIQTGSSLPIYHTSSDAASTDSTSQSPSSTVSGHSYSRTDAISRNLFKFAVRILQFALKVLNNSVPGETIENTRNQSPERPSPMRDARQSTLHSTLEPQTPVRGEPTWARSNQPPQVQSLPGWGRTHMPDVQPQMTTRHEPQEPIQEKASNREEINKKTYVQPEQPRVQPEQPRVQPGLNEVVKNASQTTTEKESTEDIVNKKPGEREIPQAVRNSPQAVKSAPQVTTAEQKNQILARRIRNMGDDFHAKGQESAEKTVAGMPVGSFKVYENKETGQFFVCIKKEKELVHHEVTGNNPREIREFVSTQRPSTKMTAAEQKNQILANRIRNMGDDFHAKGKESAEDFVTQAGVGSYKVYEDTNSEGQPIGKFFIYMQTTRERIHEEVTGKTPPEIYAFVQTRSPPKETVEQENQNMAAHIRGMDNFYAQGKEGTEDFVNQKPVGNYKVYENKDSEGRNTGEFFVCIKTEKGLIHHEVTGSTRKEISEFVKTQVVRTSPQMTAAELESQTVARRIRTMGDDFHAKGKESAEKTVNEMPVGSFKVYENKEGGKFFVCIKKEKGLIHEEVTGNNPREIREFVQTQVVRKPVFQKSTAVQQKQVEAEQTSVQPEQQAQVEPVKTEQVIVQSEQQQVQAEQEPEQPSVQPEQQAQPEQVKTQQGVTDQP